MDGHVDAPSWMEIHALHVLALDEPTFNHQDMARFRNEKVDWNRPGNKKLTRAKSIFYGKTSQTEAVRAIFKKQISGGSNLPSHSGTLMCPMVLPGDSSSLASIDVAHDPGVDPVT